jgi:hypothetical protein
MKTAAVIGGAILLAIAIAIGGYQLGWWLKEDAVNRNVDITNNNTGVQTAWADQVRQGIRDFETIPSDATAARGAIANDICELIPRLNDNYITVDMTVFAQENC